MAIAILRLGHRKDRDKRISTHLFLSSRILNVDEIYYAGEKDEKLESSLMEVEQKWGRCIKKLSYVSKPLSFIKEMKKKGYSVVHLTMYGLPYKDVVNELRAHPSNILVVVGAEKVPFEIYEIADYNVSVGLQPHSELTAMAIFLYELNHYNLRDGCENAKYRIIPHERGKEVREC